MGAESKLLAVLDRAEQGLTLKIVMYSPSSCGKVAWWMSFKLCSPRWLKVYRYSKAKVAFHSSIAAAVDSFPSLYSF